MGWGKFIDPIVQTYLENRGREIVNGSGINIILKNGMGNKLGRELLNVEPRDKIGSRIIKGAIKITFEGG
jgi:hypothetical protein